MQGLSLHAARTGIYVRHFDRISGCACRPRDSITQRLTRYRNETAPKARSCISTRQFEDVVHYQPMNENDEMMGNVPMEGAEGAQPTEGGMPEEEETTEEGGEQA